MPMRRLAVILLTVSTALTHMSLLFPDLIFILNGLGYLGLLGALYLPIAPLAPYRQLIRRILIGYTALSVLLWLAFGLREPIGYINKLNELLLIALLVWEDRQ
jgi:hypothetical protein